MIYFDDKSFGTTELLILILDISAIINQSSCCYVVTTSKICLYGDHHLSFVILFLFNVRFSNQKSEPIQLKGGKLYYLEGLHKQLYGENHFRVGAVFPDGSKHFPLEHQFLWTRHSDGKYEYCLGIICYG